LGLHVVRGKQQSLRPRPAYLIAQINQRLTEICGISVADHIWVGQTVRGRGRGSSRRGRGVTRGVPGPPGAGRPNVGRPQGRVRGSPQAAPPRSGTLWSALELSWSPVAVMAIGHLEK
jgi:hypothetical protein